MCAAAVVLSLAAPCPSDVGIWGGAALPSYYGRPETHVGALF